MTDERKEPKRTILIVDDDINLAGLVKYQLEAKGYQAVCACTGLEGLEALRSLTPDLIVMDINMPEMSGLEFYGQMLTPHGRVRFPVLVLTSRRELQETFKDIDAAGFLPKPFLAEQLVSEVERILSSPLDPMVAIFDPRQDHVARQIQDSLEEEKYRVVRIADQAAFIEKAADIHPDMVVLEYDGKQDQGTDLLSAVKAHPHLKKAKIVVYVPEGSVHEEGELRERGADAVIVNRGDYADFTVAVRKLELQTRS